MEPGTPWENGYVESFHARLLSELPNAERFTDLRVAEAREMTGAAGEYRADTLIMSKGLSLHVGRRAGQSSDI